MRPMAKLRFGTILTLGALLSLLALAGYFLVVGWGAPEGGSAMSTGGYLAMALGVLATLALGGGLMALMFYSSRRGHD